MRRVLIQQRAGRGSGAPFAAAHRRLRPRQRTGVRVLPGTATSDGAPSRPLPPPGRRVVGGTVGSVRSAATAAERSRQPPARGG